MRLLNRFARFGCVLIPRVNRPALKPLIDYDSGRNDGRKTSVPTGPVCISARLLPPWDVEGEGAWLGFERGRKKKEWGSETGNGVPVHVRT